MQRLRPYQTSGVETVMAAIDPFDGGINRALYTCPTGSGKTTMFAELIRQLLLTDHRILVLAHRIELVEQAARRITDHCADVIKPFQIGTEANVWEASSACRVIVGMVQTCCKPGRPTPQWTPTVIITDEAQHSPAKEQYQAIYDRYGVTQRRCVHIGCTATAKRLDRLSLYAKYPDGSPVMLKGPKGKPPVQANPETSVYEQLVYDYTILDAVSDGWIVEPCGYRVQTDTSLDAVRSVAGEFVEKDLAEAVDTDKRTLQAISRWKEIAGDRPTLVFCVNVEHAEHAAALWRDAGYNARDVNGKTDKGDRHKMFEDFKAGRLQVLTNCDVATEGTDLPNCSCVVCLRPTKSWNKYMQQIGRGSRPLDGLLNGMEEATAEERIAKIKASGKPNALILDVVDICAQFDDLCTAPKILDLPCNLDLEGHSVAEAKRLIDSHQEAEEIVNASLPATFTELAGRLVAVDLLRSSKAKSKGDWRVVDGATLTFAGTPPGYQATMHQQGDTWRLQVKGQGGQTLYDKTGKPVSHYYGEPEWALREYLDAAAARAQTVIEQHKEELPKGTFAALSEKQRKVLCGQFPPDFIPRHTPAEVDKMPIGYAKRLVSKYCNSFYGKK